MKITFSLKGWKNSNRAGNIEFSSTTISEWWLERSSLIQSMVFKNVVHRSSPLFFGKALCWLSGIENRKRVVCWARAIASVWSLKCRACRLQRHQWNLLSLTRAPKILLYTHLAVLQNWSSIRPVFFACLSFEIGVTYKYDQCISCHRAWKKCSV